MNAGIFGNYALGCCSKMLLRYFRYQETQFKRVMSKKADFFLNPSVSSSMCPANTDTDVKLRKHQVIAHGGSLLPFSLSRVCEDVETLQYLMFEEIKISKSFYTGA